MNMTDPIADMLTRVRNASRARQASVTMPASKMKMDIARVLKQEGYISDFEVVQENSHKRLRVNLKYSPERERAISGIKRISKPGLRIYANKDEIPKVLGGLGIAILSTSKGLLTSREAKSQGIGGEVICYVW